MKITNKKVYLKNLLILLALVVFCSISSYWHLIEQENITYTVPVGDVGIVEIKKGDVFKQDIIINDFIDKLSIYVANGGGDRAKTNNGSVEFILQQGEIKEHGYLDINGIEDWSYIDVPVNLDAFVDGTATLTIQGIDTKIGSSIFLVHQENNTYELSQAIYNDTNLPGALCVQYETGNIDSSIHHFDLFFSLSILLCIVLAVLITKNKCDIVIYTFNSVLIFCLIALRYPVYTIGGELWAEVGTIYIPSAVSNSFIGNLLELESGFYINMIGRLVAWIFVHSMPSLYVAGFAINVFSLMLVSIMGASLSSGVFKKYITPMESVVLSVLVTVCMVDAETVATPLITAYWGMIPILIIFTSFVLKINIPKYLMVTWTILGGLCVMSRMSYVILIPILLTYIIWYNKKLTKGQKLYTGIFVSLCFMEGALSLILRQLTNVASEGAAGNITIGSPLELINSLLYYQVQMLQSVFRLQSSDYMFVYNLIALTFLIGVIAWMLYQLKKGVHKSFAKGFLLILAISFGQCCLILITEGFSPGSNMINWNITVNMLHNRTWMFCYLSYLALACLSYFYLRNQDFERDRHCNNFWYSVIMSCIVLTICSVQVPFNNSTFYREGDDTGDWNRYYTMMDREVCLFPVAPSGWYQIKNCIPQTGNSAFSSKIDLLLDTNQLVSIYVTRSVSTNQLAHRPYYITVYDMSGNKIAHCIQISDLEENFIGFDLNISLSGVSNISFTYEDGTPAYIEGQYVIAYK